MFRGRSRKRGPCQAEWEAAANREVTSLVERKVYKLVPRKAVPSERKRIKLKWVMKRKADNSYKARLVAQGWDLAVHGLDCVNTFAAVCRLQSVRIFVAITVEYDLDRDHMDVSTACLYTDIQEKVLVEQAPGFVVKDKDGGELVMQLEKSLYGLAQSPGTGSTPSTPSLSTSDSYRSSPTHGCMCTTAKVSRSS